MAKERLDKILLERGLAQSRERAKALIMAGQVVVDDHLADKAGQMVAHEAEIRLKGEVLPFVSRGGLKLQKALDEFAIDVNGLVVMDVGASTGGFTDCLLQRGAKKIFAVDVGYGQLAWKLRQDERVVNLEKTNIRYLEPDRLQEIPDMAVIDASFISLKILLPVVRGWFGEHSSADVIALIKPQFEAGKKEVARGKGVIRDPAVHKQVLSEVLTYAQEIGWALRDLIRSPLFGPKGNTEFLAWLAFSAPDETDLEGQVNRALLRLFE